jgi:FAD/FMN-containing dehydrogenase
MAGAQPRGMAGLDREVADELRRGMRGPVIVPEDGGYNAARAVWNGSIDRRPAAIAKCTSVEDCAHAVNVARARELLVAVRSGGHSFAGNGVCDGGVVIDLAEMKGIRVEPDRRRAHCQGGVLWGELDRATQQFGLATPGGVISHTGVAGLTLGGGLGWLNRMYGLSCDNLLSADVVTADGRMLHATENQHADLFWGLRGGGGNFGIVTSFEFALHPVGPMVFAGMTLFDISSAAEVARFTQEWASSAPRELSTVFAMGTAPPEEFVPIEMHGQPVVIVLFCWLGDSESGARVVAQLQRVGAPVATTMSPMPYAAWQAVQDAGWAHGTRMYGKSFFVHALTDDAAQVMAEGIRARRSQLSQIFSHQVGGAVRDVPADANAYHHRVPEWNAVVAGVWQDEPDGAETETTWVRETWTSLEPHMTGDMYVNFIADAGDEVQVQRAYSSTYQRLAEVKRRYDPGNLFRVNHNVRPE